MADSKVNTVPTEKVAVAYRFESQFPGVEFRTFIRLSKEQGHPANLSLLSFVGPRRQLLRLGLVRPQMIASGRQRYADSGPGTVYSEHWSTEKLSDGRICVEFALPEGIGKDHPLFDFRPEQLLRLN